jgi:GT2 family glycosyltransferase
MSDLREPNLDVVVIHYNDSGSIDRLLDSVNGWTRPPRQTFVVDNSSNYVSSRPPAADVTVIDPGANVGYAAAANHGIRASRQDGAEFVLLLTQDAELERGAAANLLEVMNVDPEAAVVGPMLAYASAPSMVFSAGGALTANGVVRHLNVGEDLPSRSGRQGAAIVDWLDGACMLLRVSDFDAVGGFDERYFLYVEEVDFQLRQRLAGKRILVSAEAVAQQEPGNYRLYFKYRNHTFFTRKFAADLKPWPWARMLVRDSVRMMLLARWREPFWAVRGLVDGRRRRMGPPPRRMWCR